MLLPPALVASTPPICAEPSELIDSGNRHPESSAACCADLRTVPASISIVMSVVSMPRTLFMRDRLRISCDPSSDTAAPPTIDVFPPCGTIGTPRSTQSSTTAATSSVEAGRTTAGVAP